MRADPTTILVTVATGVVTALVLFVPCVLASTVLRAVVGHRVRNRLG